MRLNEALKFAEKQSARSSTAEAMRTMAELSARRGEAVPKKKSHKPTPVQIRGGADGASRAVGAYAAKGDKGNLAAGLLGAGRNFLPSDLAKLIPAAQLALDGNWSKFLSGDADGIKAALGALSSLLPPELARLLGQAAPLLTKGLESLLKDGGLPDFSKMFSLEGLAVIAAQFLPPWAGDAMAVGNQLLNGDLSLGSLAEMAAKYLPPELKAVYDAIKNLPGGWKEFLKWLFENPKEPQGANGLWAARLSDIATCPGGIGPIISPCLPTVLIGGMPAARRGDIVICNGFPVDSITIGEPTVWMGGLFAARREDDTAHQGKIITGFETVHIGKKRTQADMCAAGKCLADAADSGAATISGSGINPLANDGILGDLTSGLGDLAKNKLADFAQQKAGELAQKVLGNKDKEIYDGSNYDNPGKQKAMESGKPKRNNETPKPQPKIKDDDADFTVTKRD